MITLYDWKLMYAAARTTTLKVACNRLGMPNKDRTTLIEAPDVVNGFFIEAHKVAKLRDHYSARTIVHVLRHHSILEDGDPNFKINDHISPLLARLSMELFPALNGLFSLREPRK